MTRPRALACRLLLAAVWLWAGGCAIPIIGAPARELGQPAAERSAPGSVKPLSHWSDPAQRARAQAGRSPETCYAALEAAGVAFARVAPDQARGVQMPLRLRGPIGGVSVVARGSKRPLHAVLDCRLALALLAWAPTLRQAGVTRIEHISIYRPGARVHGSGHVSGHAHALAIDAARFDLSNGTSLDVENDWEERDLGSPPCPRRPEEAWPSRLLRTVVCDAVRRNLFQIVITPNGDRAHENHVHLERKPEVSWTYVR